ncbi:ThuA domain-containing protein [Micromonospora acroterricola]|uniref:ThuA domain-containing protein n=1 Tax=Micromonospora acroterricola TaxID=2202421 RepID=A0A317D6W8_9ACTN|nr:ThuA domain-containing protein [Micromonospora acroterricola]PWR10621.1 ThuA domain-containing protein [Micromonospora acroterricola]
MGRPLSGLPPAGPRARKVIAVDTVIFSGEGPHADPWHRLAETSAAIAGLIGDDGPVTVVTSVDRLGAALDGARLLVVNASADRSTPVPEDGDFARILDAFLGGGGSLLATHSATIAFPGLSAWRSTIGAAWDHGRSFHPPIGPSLVRRTGVEHPITAGLGDIEVHDERYTDLELVDGVDIGPLYVHDEGGATHPLVWARTVGDNRIVYNALGHDVRSYESPGHVELLHRIVAWLRHDL